MPDACRYLADIPVGHTASLNPLVAPARADLLMANRIFDEASLLQAAAILQQQQFQQHQQTLLAQANLLAMQQAESLAFLARAASQVWEIPDGAKSADEKERLIPEEKLVSQAHRTESGFEL